MPKIKYKLSPNSLINDPEAYRAIMDLDETINLKDVINFMGFHHSSLTTADMFAFVEDFNLAILRMLLDGKRVNTELLVYSLSIKGTFHGEDDQFDPSRHELVIRIRPGQAFQDRVKVQAVLEKQRAVVRKPELNKYVNTYNGAPNTVLSPAHTGRVKGHNLNFDAADPQQGLFIIPANGNSALTGEVRVDEISMATCSQVAFLVPGDLPPGPYKLELRARFGATDLRSGALTETLQVLP